jgi:hypothetical protein
MEKLGVGFVGARWKVNARHMRGRGSIIRSVTVRSVIDRSVTLVPEVKQGIWSPKEIGKRVLKMI